jgi:flotillin
MPGFHTTGPNQALVISGGGKQPKIVVGGRAFVIPILQRVQTLSLEVMTLNPQTNKVYTKEGVAVSVDGVAQVKVGSSEESIRVAVQQFLGKTPNEIAEVALQTVEGNQRSILGTMSVEEIYQDRDGFATQVREVADTDMSRMGLEIVSFTIRDIQDEQGYLEALGIGWTAEVKRDALIAQAEADRDASIRSAAADQEAQAARFAADTAIAESEQDFNIQKASYDRESNARLDEAELTYQLQAAKTQKDIREQEMQVEVIERQKQIEVQQQEVYRKEQELEATVRRPANAERDQLETVAAGNRARVIAEAEAEAILVRGHAEAEAIRAKGLAEAEAMDRKAAAWKEYGQAALIEQLFDRLPEVAAAISAPLAKTEKIVMISGGGNGESGGIGASRLTRDITSIMAELPSVVEALTGTDILSTLKNLAEFNLKNGSDDNQQLPDSETYASPSK